MNLLDFPSIIATTNETYAHFNDRAIRTLSEGVERGEIRNADFNEAKDALRGAVSRIFGKLFDEYCSIPGRDEMMGAQTLSEMFWKVRASNVHDLKAAAKRAAEYRAAGAERLHPVAGKLLDTVEELAPLVGLFDAAKPLIVKRQPMTDAQRLERAQRMNPDKIIRTCGYCLRHIAVGPDGKMVHHGYQRPGDGSQTASCRGVQHGPWERTVDGGKLLAAGLRDRLSFVERALRHLPNAEKLGRVEGRRGAERFVEYERGTPEYLDIQRRDIATFTYEQRTLIATLRDVDERVADWTQTETI